MPTIKVMPHLQTLEVPQNANLLEVLREHGMDPDAPCGGNGRCGKCRVTVDGVERLACRTSVERDMTVTLPRETGLYVLQSGIEPKRRMDPGRVGHLLAFDIGTTSVVCFLLDGRTGRELAASSMRNPQTAFGADVISRIQAALGGTIEAQTGAIRQGMTSMINQVCGEAGVSPEAVGVVSVVGNPAMQQLFLGIRPENLAVVPFGPVLTEAKVVPCSDFLPVCANADLLIIPDLSGYIGADTMGCILATELYREEELTLLVDIGTNGEMVLGNRHRMIACATAAGPALEGANIRFGMRAADGAIDRVRVENGEVRCSVIGGGAAKGICGSGLIDAVAVGLEMGLLNKRGRIVNDDHIFRLTGEIYLTQEDIRQVQLAKGAVRAGIELMAAQLGVGVDAIQKVQLAGAFGSCLDPRNACRVGLLPEVLLDRIEPVGNAAGSGAKMLACDRQLLPLTQELVKRIEFLELASLREFPKTFAKAMSFREEVS